MKLCDIAPTGSLWVAGSAVFDDGHGGILLDLEAEGRIDRPGLRQPARCQRGPDGSWSVDLSDAYGITPAEIPADHDPARFAECRVEKPAPTA